MTIGTPQSGRGGMLVAEIFIVACVLLIVGISGWLLWSVMS